MNEISFVKIGVDSDWIKVAAGDAKLFVSIRMFCDEILKHKYPHVVAPNGPRMNWKASLASAGSSSSPKMLVQIVCHILQMDQKSLELTTSDPFQQKKG